MAHQFLSSVPERLWCWFMLVEVFLQTVSCFTRMNNGSSLFSVPLLLLVSVFDSRFKMFIVQNTKYVHGTFYRL